MITIKTRPLNFLVQLLALLFFSTSQVQAAPDCGEDFHLPDRFDDPVLRWHPYIQNVSKTGATISWATRTFDNTGQVVFWEPGGSSNTVVSSVRTIRVSDDEITDFDLQHHESRLSGLNPDTDYCYRVEHGGAVIASGLNFRTAWDGSRPEVKFLVFGDSGDHYTVPWWVRDAFMQKESDGSPRYPFDFWIGLGDIAYYNGTYNDFDRYYFHSWQGNFESGNELDLSKSFMWQKPTYHAVGNHEYYDDEGTWDLNDAQAYLSIFDFPVPDDIPAGDEERYYSFDYGNTHFVSIDGQKFTSSTPTAYTSMLAWLEDDLAASNAFWKIVAIHHTPFSSGSHGTYGDGPANWRMRENMVPILQQYGVSIVFQGHDHLYQRSKRIKVDANGKIIRETGPSVKGEVPSSIVEFDDGIVYVVAGNGGIDLRNRNAEADEPGTPGFDQYALDQWHEGYDFVAKRPNGDPVLYDLWSENEPPTTPVERNGFTYVSINDCTLTVRSLTFEEVEIDNFSIDRCTDTDVTVPAVEGLVQSVAEAAIVAAGLAVGTVSTQSSASVAAGSVISQTPAGGTTASAGSAVNLVVSTGPELDSDQDTVPDAIDNCINVQNPGQEDTNGDGFGNHCDPDLNNDLSINFADLAILKSVFFTSDADADFNADGGVNFADLAIMKQFFFEAPGPSGLVP